MEELYFEVLGEAIEAFMLVVGKLKELVEEVLAGQIGENAFPQIDDEAALSKKAFQEELDSILMDLGVEKDRAREELEIGV